MPHYLKSTSPGKPMTPQAFRAAGEALYGPRWKSPLARRLGYSRTMIYNYANGSNVVPETVRLALMALKANER